MQAKNVKQKDHFSVCNLVEAIAHSSAHIYRMYVMRFLVKQAAMILTLCLGFSIAVSTAAIAQAISPDTENDIAQSEGDISELISLAEKRGMRIIVIDGTTQNDKSSDTNSNNALTTSAPGSALMRAQEFVLDFRELLKDKLRRTPDSIAQTKLALEKKSPTGNLKFFLPILYWSLLLLAFGAWVERVVWYDRIAYRWLEPDLKDNPHGYLEKIPVLLKRALIKFIGAILSMLIAFVTGSLIFKGTPPEVVQFSIATIYLGYAACRLLSIIWRLILAPYMGAYRIPYFTDKDASKLYYWLLLISVINIIFLMFGVWIREHGGDSGIRGVMVSTFGGIVALLNILMVIVNRKALSNAIRNGKPLNKLGAFTRILSKIWVVIAIGYLIFSWFEMTYRAVLDEPGGKPLIASAYGILISIICVYAIINYFIERLFQREKHFVAMKPDHSDDGMLQALDGATTLTDSALTVQSDDTRLPPNAVPAQNTVSETDLDASGDDLVVVRHTLSTYEDLARRVAGILAVIAGLWALTKVWNPDSNPALNSAIERSQDAIAILFIGYIIYHCVRIWIDNKIQEEDGDHALAPGDEGGGTGASRLATLLPLFRNFMLVVIALSVIFSALLEMGINVSPLFASAGVVGLAIGFGAQALVRDIFSGAFYLFDDAFRRGEYVDIGNVKGTVEKISVRSFQLRHHLGPLHTIPFGEIQSLTNYSRDWVMMKLPLRLTYDTDPEKVRKLIKKLGQSLLKDPVIGHTFLQPLKSQGVLEMQDSAMVFRVKFMAKPGDQWVIRKRVFQEIRDLFEKEGIKFAHKQVTVRLAGDAQPENLTQQQTKTIAAAAADWDDNNDQDGPGDDR